MKTICKNMPTKRQHYLGKIKIIDPILSKMEHLKRGISDVNHITKIKIIVPDDI